MQMAGRYLQTMGGGKTPISFRESDEQAGSSGDPAYHLAGAGREAELTGTPMAMQ